MNKVYNFRSKSKPWKSKSKQRTVFRMIHVYKGFPPTNGQVWYLDFLGKCFEKNNPIIPNIDRSSYLHGMQIQVFSIFFPKGSCTTTHLTRQALGTVASHAHSPTSWQNVSNHDLNIWAICKSFPWMFRPFWVGFPYFSLPFGVTNRREPSHYKLPSWTCRSWCVFVWMWEFLKTILKKISYTSTFE